MKKCFSGLIVLILGLVLTTPVLAKPRWDVEDSKLKLTAPPKKGSAEYARDFEILFELQEKRTEEDCAVSKRQGRAPSMRALFGPEYGVLSDSEFESVEKLGNQIIQVVLEETKTFKDHYNRVRPYKANPDIHPCTYIPGGQTSYPSAHAAAGAIMGYVLAKVYPEKAKALLREGFMVGEYRILGGVHHPSDVVAGRTLAKQILKELLKMQSFKEALDEIE